MFFRVHVRDHVRVLPTLFGMPTEEAILTMVKKNYEGYISKDLGIVLGVSELKEAREGVIIPGDGAAYYDCDLSCLHSSLSFRKFFWAGLRTSLISVLSSTLALLMA